MDNKSRREYKSNRIKYLILKSIANRDKQSYKGNTETSRRSKDNT